MSINEPNLLMPLEHLPFFIVRPGETDLLFIAVAISLVLIILGFGALYFTIQAWPDRLAKGVGKAQLQVVGILGLVSLLTMNNALWIIALVLAAIRIPDIVTPLKDISKALTNRSDTIAEPIKETPKAPTNRSDSIAEPVKETPKALADRGDSEE